MKSKPQPDKEGYYWINLSNRYGWEVVLVEKNRKEDWMYYLAASLTASNCDTHREWYGPLESPV